MAERQSHLFGSSRFLEEGSHLAVFFTTEIAEGNGKNGMSQPDRAAPRNPWPIGRFFAHSRSWASSRRSLALGEKSKSATLRAKECERNRTDCRCRFGISIASCRRSSVLNSFNRGAADLGFFAVGNERHLNVHETEWRKRRIIGRIFRTVHRTVRWTVPFSSADFRVFRSKNSTQDESTTKKRRRAIYSRIDNSRLRGAKQAEAVAEAI